MHFRLVMDGISHRGTHWTSFGHLLWTPLSSHCGECVVPLWAELCGQESGYVVTVCSEGLWEAVKRREALGRAPEAGSVPTRASGDQGDVSWVAPLLMHPGFSL